MPNIIFASSDLDGDNNSDKNKSNEIFEMKECNKRDFKKFQT